VTAEDRLRAASQAFGTAMRPVRPLQMPLAPPPARTRRIGVPRRWHGWLVPLTAAAVIASLAVALVSIRQAWNEDGPPRPSPAPQGTPATIPRYYVGLTPDLDGADYKAVVGDSLTGAVLATFTPPDGYTFGGVTAAADDRTFVVGMEPYQATSIAWYLIRVRPGMSQPATLTRLPANTPLTRAGISGLALSPDGRTLAVLEYVGPQGVSPQVPGSYRLSTSSLATGRTLHAWTTPAPSQGAVYPLPGNDSELAWSADGRTLSFRDLRSVWPHASAPNLRTLHAWSPGQDLIADSRVIGMRGGPGRCNSLQLAADGRTMVCGTSSGGMPNGCRKQEPEFDVYSTLTGRMTGIPYRYRGSCVAGAALVLWVGSGSATIGLIRLVQTGPEHNRLLAILLNGHVTALHVKLAGVPLDPGEIAF
jgi:hypothetical protein